MKHFSIILAVLALTLRVIADGTNETIARPRGRPKVAVLRFENVSLNNSMTTIINPALTPVIGEVVAREQSTSDIVITSAKQEVERYSELARSLLERELASWAEIDVLERSRLDVLERERELNGSRGGNRRQAERPYYLHGVDFMVIGQVLDVWTTDSAFRGYGLVHQGHSTHALLYIRVISVATEQEVFSTETSGSLEHLTTQFSATKHSDPTAAAIREAIRFLILDPTFKRGFVSKVRDASSESATPGDPVDVVFKPTPRRASIEIDGNYVGEAPLKRQLLLGAKHRIRIKCQRSSAWEGSIVVERNMVIAPTIENGKE